MTPIGHAHLADLQTVGEGRPADDLADRVGQGRDVAQGLGDGGHAGPVETQPVLEALAHPRGSTALDVLRVGLDDRWSSGVDGVREQQQGRVLLGTGHEGEPS